MKVNLLGGRDSLDEDRLAGKGGDFLESGSSDTCKKHTRYR